MGIILQGIGVVSKIPLLSLDHLTASRNSQVIKTSQIDSLSPNYPIIIYVHHSKSGELTNRELETLTILQKMGLQICLVVNIEKPQIDGKVNTVTPRGMGAFARIIRKNIGWDLSAYRDAYFLLKKNGLIQSQPILFMNNSVIWFPEMVKKYFSAFLKEEANVIAASISNQYRPHIQTFLFGSLNLDGTIEIEKWLKSIKNWRFKRTVVSYGELATNRLIKSQIVTKSLPPYGVLQESGLRKIQESFQSKKSNPQMVIDRLLRNRKFLQAGIPLNPSHDYWLEMFEKGFPGIKIDLIKRNPSGISDYEIAISRLLKSGYNYQLISTLISSNESKSIFYKIRRLLRY